MFPTGRKWLNEHPQGERRTRECRAPKATHRGPAFTLSAVENRWEVLSRTGTVGPVFEKAYHN